jgi:hypothetical protein
MALARTAVNRVTQASVGTRAMSSALKDMGGAIKPLVVSTSRVASVDAYAMLVVRFW